MANTRAALIRLAPVLLVAIGLVMLLLATRSFIGSAGFAYDYRAYDAAARRIVSGQPLYPPGTAEAYNSGAYADLYLYPPPPAVAFVPLVGALQQDAAALAWLWLRLAALALGIAILPISWLARAATFLTASISFPVWYDLNLGNTSVLLFALSAVIWRFRDRPAGSIALAAAGVLRYPFGIVLIGLAAAGKWRVVAWTVAAGVVIAVLTLPVVGVNAWLEYLGIVRGLHDVNSGPQNLSLATTANALGIPGPAAVWLLLGIAIAVAATVFAARRRDAGTAIVVSLAATILFFPFFHPHYLVQLLIPAGFLVGRGQWWGLALPLLGWAPGELTPLVAIAGATLPLVPARFLALSSSGDARLDAGVEFGTSPTRP
jgi:hypothetical protein